MKRFEVYKKGKLNEPAVAIFDNFSEADNFIKLHKKRGDDMVFLAEEHETYSVEN